MSVLLFRTMGRRPREVDASGNILMYLANVCALKDEGGVEKAPKLEGGNVDWESRVHAGKSGPVTARSPAGVC